MAASFEQLLKLINSECVACVCVISNLWLFVSKFTDLTPNRLHKVYRHMAKKRSEEVSEVTSDVQVTSVLYCLHCSFIGS